MTATVLSSSAEIPAWIRMPGGSLLTTVDAGWGEPAPAIMWDGVAWRNPYTYAILNPAQLSGKIALLYEFGIYVGEAGTIYDRIARSGWHASKWWASAYETVNDGWYGWDGIELDIPDVRGEPLSEGDEIVVMRSTNVSGLTGERRRVRRVGHMVTVPAMGVKNDRGHEDDHWIVHEWVKIPGAQQAAERQGPPDVVEQRASAAEVEARVQDVLQRIRSVAVEYCDEYEEAMEELGFREEDYRKGGPTRRWSAQVELTYEVDEHELSNMLEDLHGGTHSVKDGVRVISQLVAPFEWDGQDETERDDLIEQAVRDAGLDGFDDMEIKEVSAL